MYSAQGGEGRGLTLGVDIRLLFGNAGAVSRLPLPLVVDRIGHRPVTLPETVLHPLCKSERCNRFATPDYQTTRELVRCTLRAWRPR